MAHPMPAMATSTTAATPMQAQPVAVDQGVHLLGAEGQTDGAEDVSS